MMGPLRCRTCGRVVVIDLEKIDGARCCDHPPAWESITWAEARDALEAAHVEKLAEVGAVLAAEAGYPPNRAGRRAHARATGRRR